MTISSNPHVWSVVRGEMVQSGARYLTLWHWKYISWVTGGHCFHQPRIMKVSLANWKSPKKATTKWSALARRRCPVHWPRNLVHVFLGGLSLTHSPPEPGPTTQSNFKPGHDVTESSVTALIWWATCQCSFWLVAPWLQVGCTQTLSFCP